MLTVNEWVRERLENCQSLAQAEFGEIRDGWLEDARYYQMILDILAATGTFGIIPQPLAPECCPSLN